MRLTLCSVKWTWGSFPGANQPGREVVHLFPPSAEVKNEWSYTFTSPYAFTLSTGTALPLPSLTTWSGTRTVLELLRRPFRTPQARGRSEGRPFGSYGEQSCPGAAYFRSTSFSYRVLFQQFFRYIYLSSGRCKIGPTAVAVRQKCSLRLSIIRIIKK